VGRRPQGSADPRGGYAETVDYTTILGAAKLSGKTRSGWTVGLLGALTRGMEAGVVDSLGLGAPSVPASKEAELDKARAQLLAE